VPGSLRISSHDPPRRVVDDVSRTRRPTDMHFLFWERTLTWLTDGPEDDCSGPIAGRPKWLSRLKSACDDH